MKKALLVTFALLLSGTAYASGTVALTFTSHDQYKLLIEDQDGSSHFEVKPNQTVTLESSIYSHNGYHSLDRWDWQRHYEVYTSNGWLAPWTPVEQLVVSHHKREKDPYWITLAQGTKHSYEVQISSNTYSPRATLSPSSDNHQLNVDLTVY
ncbi:hypothetical protein [Dongshaea marina]|uniref:hypothetical protein n=1 Tax=Dongshaea marina TaxID=2047966 RepID=UPI000D3EAFA2|nr:hypothetical protein [Dongshaea marina]